MDVSGFSSVVQGALHEGAQFLTIPVMLILIFLVLFSIYCVGTLIVDHRKEKDYSQIDVPDLMEEINASKPEALAHTIETSHLLDRQKAVANTLLDHESLPMDDLLALGNKLFTEEENYYDKILNRSDFVAKIAPMFGLMGTLIPLGPGIVALSSGDVELLSGSLSIAFDTTTAGLVAAVIALFVSRQKMRYFSEYMNTLEAVLTAVLKRISQFKKESK